jgi:hypothetical protein
VDAERPRGVVGSGYDATPMGVAADDERLVAELRILELLDRGEEGVQVEVCEDPHRRKATVAP